jgi:hypothetical protein
MCQGWTDDKSHVPRVSTRKCDCHYALVNLCQRFSDRSWQTPISPGMLRIMGCIPENVITMRLELPDTATRRPPFELTSTRRCWRVCRFSPERTGQAL